MKLNLKKVQSDSEKALQEDFYDQQGSSGQSHQTVNFVKVMYQIHFYNFHVVMRRSGLLRSIIEILYDKNPINTQTFVAVCDDALQKIIRI